MPHALCFTTPTHGLTEAGPRRWLRGTGNRQLLGDGADAHCFSMQLWWYVSLEALLDVCQCPSEQCRKAFVRTGNSDSGSQVASFRRWSHCPNCPAITSATQEGLTKTAVNILYQQQRVPIFVPGGGPRRNRAEEWFFWGSCPGWGSSDLPSPSPYRQNAVLTVTDGEDVTANAVPAKSPDAHQLTTQHRGTSKWRWRARTSRATVISESPMRRPRAGD